MTSVGADIAWHSSSSDVGTALLQAPVETVVLHVRFQEPKGLIDTVRYVKDLNPGTRILLAASSSRALVIAEIASVVSTETWKRDQLTERERQVLALIRTGLTNREIAANLGISVSTANRYVENILHKKAVRNRAQAAAE